MNEEQNTKPYYKKWWFWVCVVIVLFFIIGVFAGDDNTNTTQITSQPNQQGQIIEIPQYTVLDKVEHISTRASSNNASYFGDVLIDENVINTPPEEFVMIARIIAKKEGLDRSVAFYLTEEAYRANYDSTWEGSDEALSEGYIGILEEDELRMSPSSTYYKLHRGYSDEENSWVVR